MRVWCVVTQVNNIEDLQKMWEGRLDNVVWLLRLLLETENVDVTVLKILLLRKASLLISFYFLQRK